MPSPRVESLALAVLDLLHHGLPQDNDTLHTLRSTFGDDSPEGLASVLADAGSAEAATLAALLLSPGPAVREALEPALEACRLTTDELPLLTDLVANGAARTAALFPDGRSAPLDLDAESARAFTLRLHPEATPPQELTRILDRRFPGRPAWRLKALLRAARPDYTSPRVFFLSALLERLEAPDGDVLAWAVRFLEERGDDPTPHQALAAKYHELSARLRQAQDFRKALAASSFEVMASRGVRLSHLHPEALREELARLDAVCRAVLGGPAWAVAGLGERDLGSGHDAWSMAELLSGLED
ncbi:hypothetical protein NNJEOMEG_00341 [Fundidesulfovibrio magnetotacticus]|uniref:Uncharacterized protein n=1 Tax=Fundidesulfovibrio magnetotacticus TaxID=2730080 RepID=A0A6V8LRV2_9BACT|nr:hypothetical protein [Fundidesulfovibrio magnetotacticus]GFK92516.1 hypothetical protein NNJEOMEG_00341 [Fundidesulfovibrio magnetotacticus]